eukprot:scaffold33549_cov72-Phaeocystis_antarctica.AAC.2
MRPLLPWPPSRADGAPAAAPTASCTGQRGWAAFRTAACRVAVSAPWTSRSAELPRRGAARGKRPASPRPAAASVEAPWSGSGEGRQRQRACLQSRSRAGRSTGADCACASTAQRVRPGQGLARTPPSWLAAWGRVLRVLRML